MIKFKDLSNWVKAGIIGGLIFIGVWSLAVLITLIQELI